MNKLDTKEAVEILLSEKKKADVKLEKAYDSYCLFPNEKDQTDWDTYSALSTALDMAISALQAQEEKYSTESSLTQKGLDTISRQAAINTVKKHYRVDNDLLEVIVYQLENLPSAQPDVPDKNVGDMVSRQAAIETARTMYERCDTLDMLDYCNLMLTALKELPSAQPEIVRCKECLMHCVCKFEQGLGLDGYCSQAKRRTDGSD